MVKISPDSNDLKDINRFDVCRKEYDEQTGCINMYRGILSSSGQLLLPCEYDDIECHGDLYFVTKNKKKGVFDSQGNNLIPCEYDVVKISDDDCDIDDVIVDSGYFILGERCPISYSGYKYHYGIANPLGKVIIPAEYDMITQVDKDRIITNWPKHVYDLDGRLVFETYPVIHDLEIMEDGYYKIAIHSETFPIELLYGVYTRDGKEVIPCQYTYIYQFKDGLARFLKGGEIRKQSNVIRKVGGAMGVFDYSGAIVVKAEYDYIRPFVDNISIVTKLLPDNILRWGAINDKGEEILPLMYSYIKYAGEGLLVFARGGDWEYTMYSARDFYENKNRNRLFYAIHKSFQDCMRKKYAKYLMVSKIRFTFA